jgi:hypothetical protein
MKDEGALALETFAADFLPLVILFTISVTGLALTWRRRYGLAHFTRFGGYACHHGDWRFAVSTVRLFSYLPATGAIGRETHRQAGAEVEGVLPEVWRRFASQMRIDDLRVVPQLGFGFTSSTDNRTGGRCARMQRKSVATAQLRVKRTIHG